MHQINENVNLESLQRITEISFNKYSFDKVNKEKITPILISLNNYLI